MDITAGIKRIGTGPVYAFGLANEDLFCLLYKGKKTRLRESRDACIYVDEGYWSRGISMQGQLTGLGTHEDYLGVD